MSYLDGNLLAKAMARDRESIMALCKYLSGCQKAGIVPDDGAIAFLCHVLENIGNGQDPNQAFGWSQLSKGRRRRNSAFESWDIRLSVQALMKRGETWTAACFAVSSDGEGEFLVGQKKVEQVCAGLTVDMELPIPDDIFPLEAIPSKHRRRV